MSDGDTVIQSPSLVAGAGVECRAVAEERQRV